MTINMLGDADSTGSVTGQIAGAFYGYQEIEKVRSGEYVQLVNKWDDRTIALRAVFLYNMYASADVPSPTEASAPSGRF